MAHNQVNNKIIYHLIPYTINDNYYYSLVVYIIINLGKFNMGQSNSQVADPFITLCLVTTKKYYFPGEYVEGEIYLIAQTARPYSQLSLILYGEESVEWEDVRNVGDEDEERSRYAKKEKIY